MSGKGGTPMTTEAAGRIQSSEAKQGGGKVEAGGFASRAQLGKGLGWVRCCRCRDGSAGLSGWRGCQLAPALPSPATWKAFV